MDIHFNVCFQEAIHSFQQNVSRSFTDRHKKVVLIASIALGLLAACYLVKRYFSHTTSLIEPSNGKKVDSTLSNDNEVNEPPQNDNTQFKQQANQTRELLDEVKASLSKFEQEKVKKFQSQLEQLIDQIRKIDADGNEKPFRETARKSLFSSIEQLIKLHLTLGTSKNSIYTTLEPYFEQYPEITEIANRL